MPNVLSDADIFVIFKKAVCSKIKTQCKSNNE